MSVDTLMVVIAITMMCVTLALITGWDNRQPRKMQQRRRPF